jgi:tetratricopeptide (TPR) repeat protein
MRRRGYIFIFALGLVLIPRPSCAQENEIKEEESAEVFLEEYTDEFQEKFFEALKQKGIENYDRAVNLLLECKRLDPNNSVLDHELAKAYLASKQVVLAQQYGISALNASPDNFWVLNTIVDIMQRQGLGLDVVKDKIPYNNVQLQENLALIYFKQENYENALKILNGIKNTVFSKELTSKIYNSIKSRENSENQKDTVIVKVEKENPTDNYLSIISGYLAKSDFKSAASVSEEAIENFPAQPYFYYAYGLSLNKIKKHKEAIAILESGLDYLLDDIDLANKMYKELVDANNALGNSSKANMYLSKLKSGS